MGKERRFWVGHNKAPRLRFFIVVMCDRGGGQYLGPNYQR